MKELEEDGAMAAGTALSPRAMENRVGHPYTHWQDSTNEMKATEQSPPAKTHIVPCCKVEEVQ